MNDFIAIDFETGMYSPESAISIGLVKYQNYRPVDSYYSLIRPPKLYIRPDFTGIHGLTVDDVKDAPDFKYLWENEILAFLGPEPFTVPLVAHYAAFDIKVLCAALKHYEIPAPSIPYFCSCILSRRVWPAFRSHALTALAKEFNITYEAHNALADADTCAQIVLLCAMELSAAEETKEPFALEELLKKTGVAVKNVKGQP